MSPQLAHLKRIRSRDEISNNLSRFKHAFSILSIKRKPQCERSIDRSKSFDDQTDSAYSTIQSYMSNLKLKFRRINASSSASDTKGTLSFRALDGKKSKTLRPTGLDAGATDRYIPSNAQTVANDSTDQRFLRMYINGSPWASNEGPAKRRSSFSSSNLNNRSFLSVGVPSQSHNRDSFTDSELTVASEDLTAKEFAEHLGINVYPEEEDEAFGNINIFLQHRHYSNHPQSTVLSSTRSTKSKISIMEDSFWMPPSSEIEKGDEESLPRKSSESAGRRNSFIASIDPHLSKNNRQGSPKGLRAGRHSAPDPIPIPKPMPPPQMTPQNYTPSNIEMTSSVSTPSSDSSFSFYSNSLTARSIASSVSTTTTIPFPIQRPSQHDRHLEHPTVSIIKSEFAMEPIIERETAAPKKMMKGRFEITIGDAPPPEPLSPRSSIDGNEGGIGSPTSPTATDERCVIFQRRKNRPGGASSNDENLHGVCDERRRSMSMSVIQ